MDQGVVGQVADTNCESCPAGKYQGSSRTENATCADCPSGRWGIYALWESHAYSRTVFNPRCHLENLSQRHTTEIMKAHLSHVAAGSTQTDLASHIRQIGHCFEQGVPADDETCVRMMRALPNDDDILLKISADFGVSLNFLGAGQMRFEDENGWERWGDL